MAYAFAGGVGVGQDVARILTEELDGAIAELRGQRRPDRVTAIHEARKHLKKARSVLRLVRKALDDDKVYAKESGRLRDAGRRLSAVRDAQVAVATLEKLAAAGGQGGQDVPAGVGELRPALVARQEAATEQARGDAELVAEVITQLERSRERLARLRLDRKGFKALRGGLERGYERGARAAQRAEAKPNLEHFHDWRKRVKDTWYHLRLLEPAWPAVLEPLAEQAHRLSELLGDDHDLGVLRETAAAKDSGLRGAARTSLLALIDDRRAELQREAFRLRPRFYAESSKAFTERIGAYWHTWREETPQQVEPVADETAVADNGAGPVLVPEPQLPRPALGSVERGFAVPSRPLVIPEPQLAPPALGSHERPAFVAASPARPAAPLLPPPALGSREGGGSTGSVPQGEAATAQETAPPAAVGEAEESVAETVPSHTPAAQDAPADKPGDVAPAPDTDPEPSGETPAGEIPAADAEPSAGELASLVDAEPSAEELASIAEVPVGGDGSSGDAEPSAEELASIAEVPVGGDGSSGDAEPSAEELASIAEVPALDADRPGGAAEGDGGGMLLDADPTAAASDIVEQDLAPAEGEPAADGEVGPAAGATAEEAAIGDGTAEQAPDAAGPGAPTRAETLARLPSRTGRPRRAPKTVPAEAPVLMVFVTTGGRRFHRSTCLLAGPSARELSREDAAAAGLTPCASCRP